MEVTRVEQRAYIKTAVLRKRNAMECHSELEEALGNNALPYRTVPRWIGKFQQGRVSTSDEQRSWHPVSVRTDLACAVIEQLTDYISVLPKWPARSFESATLALNSCRAASPLVRLVEGKERWEAPTIPRVCSLETGVEPSKIILLPAWGSKLRLTTGVKI
ncbi:HTH_48 domain-containing protein [Trichonephila clavipes]|nr:HTH_48 domain-containing protein [Trichonephila clavipes]